MTKDSAARPRWSCVLMLVAWLAMLAAAAHGQQNWPGASSPATVEHPESHAWVVLKDHAGRPGSGPAVLVHIPPRTGELPAETGSAHLVRTLNQVPLAAAAWGEDVYLAFNGVGPDRESLVRVRSLRAQRQGFGWAYAPLDRFMPHAALVHRGAVGAMTAAEGVVVVVMTVTDSGDEVFALVGGRWSSVALPPLEPGTRLRAWNAPGGASVGWLEGGVLHAADLLTEGGETRLDEPRALGPVPAGAAVWSMGRMLFAVGRGHESLRVSALEDPSATAIVSLEVREQAGVVPVFADGPRLIALWWERPERDGRPSPLPALHALEVSLSSGATLHSGPQPASKLISADEFRMLAMLLFIVVLGVLVIVLKGDLDRDAVPLPPGVALAEPSRRFVGSGIDFAVAAVIVARIYGVDFWDLVSLRVLFLGDGEWTAIPATFVAGGIIGMLCEWAFGRTVGKLITRTRVVRAVPTEDGARIIGLRRAFIRNATKWLLPPVAVLAAVDGNGRHRGDQMAGVVVVVEIEPEGPRA